METNYLTWLWVGHGKDWTLLPTPSGSAQPAPSVACPCCACPKTSLFYHYLQWSALGACSDCNPRSFKNTKYNKKNYYVNTKKYPITTNVGTVIFHYLIVSSCALACSEVTSISLVSTSFNAHPMPTAHSLLEWGSHAAHPSSTWSGSLATVWLLPPSSKSNTRALPCCYKYQNI